MLRQIRHCSLVKSLCLLLALCAVIPALSVGLPVSASPSSPPPVSAEAAVLMEVSGRTVLFEKNADVRMPMASTTKIMTALVAIENSDPDMTVEVDPCAVGVEGSSVYLYAGEKLTLRDLLYALLLESANDAAVAIAVAVAGNTETFVGMMNDRAASMGLSDTHFSNPHGLDHKEHYTTARDLARIAAEAMEDPLFREIVSTRKKIIPLNGNEGVRVLVNHNKLLRMYDGAVGVKTGFTRKSGRCLVGAAERDGVTLITVTLEAPDDWNDHMTLFDFGFSTVVCRSLAKTGEWFLTLPVIGPDVDEGGDPVTVRVANRLPLQIVLPAGHGPIRAVVEAPAYLFSPVLFDEEIGRVVFFCAAEPGGAERVVATLPLCADSAVETPRRLSVVERLIAFLKRLFHKKTR